MRCTGQQFLNFLQGAAFDRVLVGYDLKLPQFGGTLEATQQIVELLRDDGATSELKHLNLVSEDRELLIVCVDGLILLFLLQVGLIRLQDELRSCHELQLV